MAIQARHLPALTLTHLFNIVINNGAAVSEAFIQRPVAGRAGTSTKFGWEAGLPAGGGGAGRDRLLRFTEAARVTWWRAHHVGDNSYAFEQIVVRRCAPCAGTGDAPCATCNSLGMPPVPTVGVGQCAACAGRGYNPCAGCRVDAATPPKVIDGVAVSRTRADW